MKKLISIEDARKVLKDISRIKVRGYTSIPPPNLDEIYKGRKKMALTTLLECLTQYYKSYE